MIHRLDDASQLQPGDVVACDDMGHLAVVVEDPKPPVKQHISVLLRLQEGTSRYFAFAEGFPFDAYRVQLHELPTPTAEDNRRKAFYDRPENREPANDDKPVARRPKLTPPTVGAEAAVIAGMVEDMQRMRGDLDEITRRLAQIETVA